MTRSPSASRPASGTATNGWTASPTGCWWWAMRCAERVLAGASVRSRYVEVGAGNRVHLLEMGAGPPVVLLHGGGGAGGFFLPLLNELQGVRALAPDRPGQGLSDPIDLSRNRYRESAVTWLDGLLDTLELDATALLGHSGAGCGRCGTRWHARTG
jgi:pimeloyl-ACP methyl ester carboxylesterase